MNAKLADAVITLSASIALSILILFGLQECERKKECKGAKCPEGTHTLFHNDECICASNVKPTK
jgi:hypothetical protein